MKSRRGAGPPGTVLVVDPDDALRRNIRKWLEARDFLVLDAGDAGDAERIARVFVGPIHLLLIEISLPGTAGGALAERLRSIHAESQAIFTGTRSQPELVRRRELRGDERYMRKPLDEERLLSRIQEALTQSS
jgi:DNA-binding response OmpR family regulator